MSYDSQSAFFPTPTAALCPRCRARVEDPHAIRCRLDGWRLVPDRSGTRVGRFSIEGFLGVGANGTVWRATDEVGHAVAVKLLHPRVPAEAQRFERGARLAQSLDHTHIARTFGLGRIADGGGELLYLDMELLDGETLAVRQSRQPRFSPGECARVADQVLHALEHVHARGIVHRDLKPSNLFIEREPEGHVKILDFGIAKLVGPLGRTEGSVVGPFLPDDSPDVIDELDEVTGQHKICGTPEYMAPEQVLGARADVRSDLYGLGVILYKMFTGHLPFRGRTRVELYHQHLHVPPPALPAELGVPPALAAVVMRALAKSPDDRFPTARVMREAVAQAEGRRLPSPTPLPRLLPGAPTIGETTLDCAAPAVVAPPRPRSRRRAYAVAFFVASVLALATVVATKLVGSG